jgi:hypothetical protein
LLRLFFENYIILIFIHQILFIMKKLMILLAVTCLVFVSCNITPKVTEPEQPKCEFATLLEKWDTFGDLDEAGQAALIAEMKAYFDECCKEKCEKEGEEAEELSPEEYVDRAAFRAFWEDWDNLDVETQKGLIEKCIEHKKECCKENEATEEVAEETAAE